MAGGLLTFSDWEKAKRAGDLPAFIRSAIDAYRESKLYKRAKKARAYAEGENEGIQRRMTYIEKYGLNDIYFSRIGNGMYPRMVRHLVFYTLGNGLDVDQGVKKRLGQGFDRRFLIEGVMPACDAGVCYAFWNGDRETGRLLFYDALGAFPMLDERTGSIRVLIRFWQVASGKPLCVETYEEDGITEYQSDETGKGLAALGGKKAYTQTLWKSPAGEKIVLGEENHPRLPIFPLYVNIHRKSEMTDSLLSVLDAYDFVASDQVDQILRDEGIFWTIKNYGGEDLQSFLEKLETKVLPTHGDVNAEVISAAMEAPFHGKQAALEWLEGLANAIFSMPDSIGNRGVTATEIKDANKYLDTKADVLEWRACEFIAAVLDFLGVSYEEESLAFKRRSITNDTETINNISTMLSDGYVDEEFALSISPLVPDDRREAIQRRMEERMQAEALNALDFDEDDGGAGDV